MNTTLGNGRWQNKTSVFRIELKRKKDFSKRFFQRIGF